MKRHDPIAADPFAGPRIIGILLALGILAGMAAIVSGCASHATRQVDRRPDGTEVSTRARSVAFMAGKSALRDVKVTQTEKTQGMSVGRLDQESDATALSESIGNILVRGLAAYLTGGAGGLPSMPASAPAPASVPPGFKLVPTDDPSRPHPEIQP
jgi:hypothetical protein